ncbi:MAG: metal ABC transporter permease [Candidatus Promineifilaceae bacterium]|jgi:manganese/zinc/iron transport system permease protein
MDLGGLINDLFFDYTLRTVAMGAGILGLVSGALGSFAMLRKQSLMGDAISHAALPGIVLAFMLTRSKASLVLVLGAAIAGWMGMLLVLSVVRYTRVKEDSALGLILSVFFGLGLMLLTFVQRWPDATQAGLDKFLFGQAAALLQSDVVLMGVLGGLALAIMALFWKEFKLFSFDREYGATLGFPARALDILLTTLLVTAIVIGLQAVGVVLMSAMIVAPAAAARQWTDKLSVMVALAGFFGALAGVSGAVISSTASGFSTGPVIVLSVSVIVLFSLLFAPNRGLVWNWARKRRNRRTLHVEAMLEGLYQLAAQHEEPRAHDIAVLRAMNLGRGGVERSLRELEREGLAEEVDGGWVLTEEGMRKARTISDLGFGISDERPRSATGNPQPAIKS